MSELLGGLRGLEVRERAVFQLERARRERDGVVRDQKNRRWVRRAA